VNLSDRVRAATGRGVLRAGRVGGGDINEGWMLELDDGTPAFAKTRSDAAAGEYAAEAAGLAWLAEPGALRIPRVLGVSDQVLVLEWVDEGNSGDAAALGAGLAELHAAGADAFGATPPAQVASGGIASTETASGETGSAETASGETGSAETASGGISFTETASGETGSAETASGETGSAETASGGIASTETASGETASRGIASGGAAPTRIGPLLLSNEPTPDWPTFYAERRLRPVLARARLSPTGVRAVERVCERLPELAGPPEPPARLHGDLWGGNVLWDRAGAPWLIDPAVYGGHREVDLAMLQLFGSPGPAFFAAYEARRPLADGHAERTELWQLFPLLVHAALFGGSYGDSAARVAERYA
jgi:fructosamine-3-kinase